MVKEQAVAECVEARQSQPQEDGHDILTYEEIAALMEHDSYRRIRGKIRQLRWGNSDG